MNIKSAIQDIITAFDKVEDQPIKLVREIDKNVFCSIMPAQTDKVLGCKVITWNEDNGETDAVVVRVIDGKIVVDRVPMFTAFRCALMALSSAYQVFLDTKAKLKLGIVGYGKIGKAVEELFKQQYDIQTVVLESPRKKKNPDPSILKDCDVVVTATTTRDDPQIEYNNTWKTKLFISFDGGYILGSSFRKLLPSKSDYPEQILRSFFSEFPNDKESPDFGYFNQHYEGPHCVYIYGTGLADLIAMRYYNVD